jgi:hypothetical protein
MVVVVVVVVVRPPPVRLGRIVGNHPIVHPEGSGSMNRVMNRWLRMR